METEKVQDIKLFLKSLPKFEVNFIEDIARILPVNEGKCICGSNKLFRDCCIKIAIQTQEYYQELHFSKGSNFANKEWKEKVRSYIEKNKSKNNPSSKIYKRYLENKNAAFCLAKDICEDCEEGLITNAHTIGRKTVIEVLSHNKMESTITFNRFVNFPKDDINDYFIDIKDRDASTVNTFCKKHDKLLFKNIENKNEYSALSSQNLEYSLNCIALAVYSSLLQILFTRQLLKDCPELWLEPRVMQDYYTHVVSIKDSYELSQYLIESIVKKKDILNTFDYKIKDLQIKFALCETIHIEFDMLGLPITEHSHCMINLFPLKDGSTQIVFSIFNNVSVYDALFTQLEEAKKHNKTEKIIQYFAEVISNKATNMYFEAHYFNQLLDLEKAVLYYFYSRNGALEIANDIKEKMLVSYSDKEIKEIYIKVLFKELIS